MKRGIFQIFFFWTIVISGCSTEDSIDWREGDILFQDGDCGDFCEAIRKVTTGYEGRDFSHNGLLMREDGDWYVLEAISAGVSKTGLNEFLSRYVDPDGNPKVIMGRLKPNFQPLIPQTIDYAVTLIGKPYDAYFDLTNDAYYCSELIHLSLQKANNGYPIFQTQPMTFNDPDTKEPFNIWVEYFKALGTDIPENEPGLNPGGMSTDPAIDIVYDFSK